MTLPVHASLYLRPDVLEDIVASYCGGYQGNPRNTQLLLMKQILVKELNRRFKGWREYIDPQSLTVLSLYAYRFYGPAADLMRCKSPVVHNAPKHRRDKYLPLMAAFFVGAFQWACDDKYAPCEAMEAILDMMEDYLDRVEDGDVLAHGTLRKNVTKPVQRDLHRIVMAFHPLFKSYVEVRYEGTFERFDAKDLRTEAEGRAYSLFGVTLEDYETTF